MKSYALESLGMVNALGIGFETIYRRLVGGDTSCLSLQKLRTMDALVPVGKVNGDIPRMPEHLMRFNCRNHSLALMAYQQIDGKVNEVSDRYGPHRVAVVVGSSTSGLDATELAYFNWKQTGEIPKTYNFTHQHDMGSIARFIGALSGVKGPTYTLSTACSSSAKVFAAAKGLLDLGVCDAVITGGVDAICHLTLDGFESLGSLSRQISNPMSANRDGLNIGEGAALFVLTRAQGPISLFGVGESCDAYHMSAPQPDGLGAEAAMAAALEDADLKPSDLAYLNLHGTGTPLNDVMEAKAVQRIFGTIPCSSTKPLVGHALGVAGAMEVGFCWQILNAAGRGPTALPPHVWDGAVDRDIPEIDLVTSGHGQIEGGGHFLMSNSFAFGGNNCSVIIGNS